MLETISGNIMTMQGYIQGQFEGQIYLQMADKSFSGICLVIQGHMQRQKVNFKGK